MTRVFGNGEMGHNRFCRAHECNQQTDRQTYHASPRIAIGMLSLTIAFVLKISVVLAVKNLREFYYSKHIS